MRFIAILIILVCFIGCEYKTTSQPQIEQPKEITEINLGGVSDGVVYYPPQPVVPITREIEVYVSPNDPNGYREPESTPPNPIYGGYGSSGGYYIPPVVIPTVTVIWRGNIVVDIE